jgi:hypothetical protein
MRNTGFAKENSEKLENLRVCSGILMLSKGNFPEEPS